MLDRRVSEADQVFSALVYGGVAKKLVWRTKFDALEEAGIVLGYHLAVALQAYDITGTLVTWVPMPSKRQRERGIDHAQLLAREVAQSLGVPCRALLARTARDQAEQHTLSREERQENAKRAFCPAPDAPALQGEHILLIDDVLTDRLHRVRLCRSTPRHGSRNHHRCDRLQNANGGVSGAAEILGERPLL